MLYFILLLILALLFRLKDEQFSLEKSYFVLIGKAEVYVELSSEVFLKVKNNVKLRFGNFVNL